MRSEKPKEFSTDTWIAYPEKRPIITDAIDLQELRVRHSIVERSGETLRTLNNKYSFKNGITVARKPGFVLSGINYESSMDSYLMLTMVCGENAHREVSIRVDENDDKKVYTFVKDDSPDRKYEYEIYDSNDYLVSPNGEGLFRVGKYNLVQNPLYQMRITMDDLTELRSSIWFSREMIHKALGRWDYTGNFRSISFGSKSEGCDVELPLKASRIIKFVAHNGKFKIDGIYERVPTVEGENKLAKQETRMIRGYRTIDLHAGYHPLKNGDCVLLGDLETSDEHVEEGVSWGVGIKSINRGFLNTGQGVLLFGYKFVEQNGGSVEILD